MARKNKIKLVAILVILTILLAACSSDKKTENQPNQSVGQSNQNDPAGKVEEVTLVVWVGGSLYDDERVKKLQEDAKKKGEKIIGVAAATAEIKKAFEEKYPGVKLKFESHGWADELTANLQRAVLGGTGPDVVQGESQIYEFAKLNAFKELSIDDEMKQDLLPGPLSVATVNDKIYGLPFMTGTFALQYNKDVLRKAGFDPDKDIPKTWDELVNMVNDITAKGNGEYYGYMINASDGLGSMFRAHPWVKQMGTDFGTADGDATFNSPDALKAYEFLRELAKNAPPGAASLNEEGKILAILHTGQAAFQIDGPWQIDWAKQDKCDCGYARLPVPSEGKTGNSIVGNIVHSVLRDTKHPKEAEDFVRFLASPEGQEIVMRNTPTLPINKKALERVPDYFETNPELRVFYDELEQAKNIAPLPTFKKNSSQVIDQWTILKNMIFDPKQDLKASADKVQKASEEAMQ
ncbi:ABC transporter substrate-binding protein [Paenibacillus nasutitermitis]|uniref:ABC transporter substrate-binding protein n=1 Tax=Paenibacillus nasutitermitis TaxID=1652958 RepID=A0A916YVU5_9BACL|nr:extracellular solute-binding protein [Paenibacillus nasutitermitis]GGD62898.1 ABC transporter substrate-binding protein [Paenibacillus nasutitermitis]